MDDITKQNLLYGGLILIVIVTCTILIIKFSQPVVIDLHNFEPLESFEGDVKDFVIVAQRFAASHDYNRTGYNCVNYSTDLKHIADQLGFSTQVVKGCPDGDGTCHYWLRLEVDFEPQSAMFQDFSKDFPHQEVIDGKVQR